MAVTKNDFKQFKKTIDGVEYTAQFNGVRAALSAVDNCYIDGSSNISSLKLTEYILENVIIDPKVTVDDFKNVKTLNKLTEWGRDVMQGEFND